MCTFVLIMNIIEIHSLDHPGTEIFHRLTEAQLRNKLDESNGLFIVESPKVIDVALRSGAIPVALMCEKRHINGDAAGIIARCGDIPIYTGPREVLASITGYTLTRGVLCAMKRPVTPSVEDICRTAHRIVVLDGIVDTTNIGSIFRSAAALGVDGVLLTRTSCDPLNRRAVRVSMGSVFLVPWAWLDSPINSLKRLGIKTAAMALSDHAVSIEDSNLMIEERLAIILGTEGDGLPDEVIDQSDYVVKIPMWHDVDSLNVGVAAAIAFWQLRYIRDQK